MHTPANPTEAKAVPNSPQITDTLLFKNRAHPLKIYSYYRFIISCLFFGSIFLKQNTSDISSYNALLFVVTAACYLVITLVTIIYTHLQSQITQSICFFVVATDILVIATLAHASGGISNDVGILLIVAIAAGSIMTATRMATTIAALATLVILFEHWYFSQSHSAYYDQDSVHTGLLGTSFFITSLLIQSIANRLRESEKLTFEATFALAELEELNRQIIQRMRTGIIVMDQLFRVKTMNESAQHLLDIDTHHNNSPLATYSEKLYKIVQDWQHTQSAPLQKIFKNTPQGTEVIASITHLNTEDLQDYRYILVFLEDNSRMTQQALQLKLASLGQLTAAIAHEVRNPLGAISHAAQLLLESNTLDLSDERLARIIQDHSVRVNQIIENVLSLSRRKPSETQRFNITCWLEKFIDEFPQGHAIQLQITDPEITVAFDPNQLTQVLSNLVENGLRYSKKNQHDSVRITTAIEPKSGRPYLDVQDYGVGISAEQQKRLFEPFFTTESSGTGLGLYISREICQVHQARLDLMPKDAVKPPRGACFRITFSHPDKLLKP